MGGECRLRRSSGAVTHAYRLEKGMWRREREREGESCMANGKKIQKRRNAEKRRDVVRRHFAHRENSISSTSCEMTGHVLDKEKHLRRSLRIFP